MDGAEAYFDNKKKSYAKWLIRFGEENLKLINRLALLSKLQPKR